MNLRLLSGGFLLCALLIACSERQVDYDKERAALMQVSRDWSELVAAGDMEAAFDFWADDGVMLSGNEQHRLAYQAHLDVCLDGS